MVKRLLIFTIALVFFQLSEAYAQINIGTVDAGPYGNGSHITVPITFPNNLSDLPIDNKFEVFLSDENGNFTGNGNLLGTFNGFYTPAVNGTIPANLPAGSGYKLRIRTSNPNNTPAPVNLDVSGNITIVSQDVPNVTLTQTDPSNQFGGDHLGVCPTAAASNKSITVEDNVSAATTVTLTVTNLVSGSVTIFSEVANEYEITGLAIGYYSVVATAINGQLVKSIRTYTLHNEAMGLGLGDNSVSIGCLSALGGGSPVSYGIINIDNNYPGTIYRINWGDGVVEQFTRNQIINNSNLVTHTYTETSCERGGAPDGSNNNSFQATISTIGIVCNTGNKSLTAYAQVFLNPVANITGSSVGCVNTEMTFNNTSLVGTNIDCNDEMLYTWYIDNNPNYVLRTRSKIPLKSIFTTPGNHSVRLVASNEVQVCESSEFIFPVCIQTPPKPAFQIIGGTNGCAPFAIQLQDQSDIYTDCGPAPSYKWIVTDANGVRFTNFTDNIPNPSFVLTTPGAYTIKLELTGSCGVFSTAAPDPVVITDGSPQITLSGPKKLCTLGKYTFDDSSISSPTYTTFSGSPVTLATTYTWTVTNIDDTPLTSDDYSFDVGSSTNSKFPVIIFKKTNIKYKVTVVHANSCGTRPDFQILEFFDAPEINAGADQDLCFTQDLVVQLNGTVPPNITNPKWMGGAGTFGDIHNPNTTYTPTLAEKNSGVPIVLNFTGETTLEPPCSTVTDETRITIKREILITSSPTKSICTNTDLNYGITSNQTGTSYTWTATGSADAEGYSQSTIPTQNPIIADRLINKDSENNATVTYTITPYNYGCQGESFTLTVTITPRPILTATPIKPVICSHTSSNITLSSTLGNATKYTWTSTKSDGSPANPPQLTPVATNNIDEIIINNTDLQETITYIITPISVFDCPGTPVTILIKVDPAVTPAKAGPDESICAITSYTLKSPNTTLRQGETGLWTVSPSGPIITPNNVGNAAVTDLTIGTEYTFTWTITASSGCSTTDDVVIKVLNPITNVITAPSTTTVCEGQTIVINGQSPSGGAAPYTYRWEISTDNGTSWPTIVATTPDLTYTVTESALFRRVVTGGACEGASTPIAITMLPSIKNNTIRNDQTICPGGSAQLLTGDAPSGGDGSNYSYQWEQSIDNGSSWSAIQNATLPSYLPVSVAVPTQYRRRVSSAACSGALGNISNVVTISIYAPSIAEFTTESLVGCPPFLIDKNNIKVIQHPGNATYTWYVNNVVHGTGPDFPDYTILDGNRSVEIKLIVTNTNGCPVGENGEKTAIFSTRTSVNVGFTQSIAEGCGPLPVTFTNTSNSLTDVTFKWDFGNGETSTNPNPPIVTYQPDPSGNDITYVVTLTAETPCSGIITSTSSVLVKAKPIAVFTPDEVEVCSPYKITFTNTSPGSTNTYYYDFGDGSAIEERNDKSNVEHIYNVTVTTEFTVRMIAKNECDVDEKEWKILVYPRNMTPVLGIKLEEIRGCAPHTVNFENNSIGASRFVFDFGDGSPIRTTFTTGIVSHTYTTSGNFTATMTAFNTCSEIPVTKSVSVLQQPTADFEAENTLGCPGLVVKFKNKTEGGLNNSYLWDFGDGTFSPDFEPEHIYTGDQEYYTVKLLATNQLGCPIEVTKTQYIHIVQPPVAAFNVNPSTLINIPDYTFRFEDESTNTPTIWEWDFGDGTGSALKNPSHTYLDTGTYRVTLRVLNQQGCFTSTFKNVTIKGVPGYLFVPNSFVPGNTQPELREFRAKGSGIATWRFSVFNKWGQLLWETTKLEEGRPVEGWDGTYKGQQLPQGVYFWKADVQMVNGSEWKGMTYDSSPPRRTGPIHLIR